MEDKFELPNTDLVAQKEEKTDDALIAQALEVWNAASTATGSVIGAAAAAALAAFRQRESQPYEKCASKCASEVPLEFCLAPLPIEKETKQQMVNEDTSSKKKV